jgi:hypothetical protein
LLQFRNIYCKRELGGGENLKKGGGEFGEYLKRGGRQKH